MQYAIIVDGCNVSKTNLVKILLVALMAAGGALFFWARHQPPRHAPEVGDSAPDFTLPVLGAGSVALGEIRRRVVVLNFWATWCPPCVEETPSLEKFAAETRGLGVTVIGVSVDQDAAALRKFAAHHRLSFPIARDPNQAVSSRYGTFKFPETYIIDRYGKIAEKIIGATDWQDPRMTSFVRNLARPGEGRGP